MITLPSSPTSSTTFAHFSDGTCTWLLPPLAGPAPLSAPRLAACGSPKRVLKHSWSAPGLSAPTLNEVQLARLAHPRPCLRTASPHLMDRLIAFEHGQLGAPSPPVDYQSMEQTDSSSSRRVVQPAVAQKIAALVRPLGRPLSPALATWHARCMLLFGPMGPVKSASVGVA